MREQPSDDMIDERLAAWQAGDYPEGWSVYDALGWSRNEYMTWLADRSRVPERPLSALPDPEIYAPMERHQERVESAQPAKCWYVGVSRCPLHGHQSGDCS
jgi:hypothetical protein